MLGSRAAGLCSCMRSPITMTHCIVSAALILPYSREGRVENLGNANFQGGQSVLELFRSFQLHESRLGDTAAARRE